MPRRQRYPGPDHVVGNIAASQPSSSALLLLDEPTDNLDLASADALQRGLEGFAGTVVTATHDRWFAAHTDRYLLFGADGQVHETDEPVWTEGRVDRPR